MVEPPTPSRCLDPTVVAEIRALSSPGEDVLAEIVGIFLADVPQQFQGLRAALAAGDLETTRQIAHRLRGTALGTGARRLADVCALVENAARDGDLDRAAAHAATLDDEFHCARVALEHATDHTAAEHTEHTE